MRASSIVPLGVVFGAAISVGCSATVSAAPEGSDAEVSQAATAIVEVKRIAGPSESQLPHAVARFVQMRSGAVDHQALQLVTAAVELPAMGACVARGQAWSALEASASAPARPLNLADVGAISLEAGGSRTTFATRKQPDVTDLVTGLFYHTRWSDAASLPAQGRYVLHVAGASTIDPFDVPATAPGELTEVRVAGQDTPIVTPATTVMITPETPVDITWEAGSSSDVVFIDVDSRDPGVPGVRCLFPDGGQANLAAWTFSGIETGTVSLHRLHREEFRARGVDSGEIRFDFARVISFARR